MMRLLIITIALAFLWGCTNTRENTEDHTGHEHASAEPTESKPKSPKQMAMTNVGDNHVHIEYSSPGKRGRQIFGGLVAYDEVWVTGAHKATVISFTRDVKIGEIVIPKGKYALFTIPGKEEWTVIINKNWDQHLADEYDQGEDLVRVKVKPTKLSETVESLTYEVKEIDKTSGEIIISWDDVSISFNVINV